jgi:hypothetical protein
VFPLPPPFHLGLASPRSFQVADAQKGAEPRERSGKRRSAKAADQGAAAAASAAGAAATPPKADERVAAANDEDVATPRDRDASDGDGLNTSFSSFGALNSSSKRAKEAEDREKARKAQEAEDAEEHGELSWQAQAVYTDTSYQYSVYFLINEQPTLDVNLVLLLAAARCVCMRSACAYDVDSLPECATRFLIRLNPPAGRRVSLPLTSPELIRLCRLHIVPFSVALPSLEPSYYTELNNWQKQRLVPGHLPQ